MEHPPLDARQREDRQVDRHDDQLAEQQRAARLGGGQRHLGEALLACERPPGGGLGQAEAPDAVLDDDDGAVDDDAEVERAQAHQVGADARLHHAGEDHQHRQRNHQGRDQGRAQVAQEKDGHDQQRAFDQVGAHGGNRLVDQHRAVVNRQRLHAGRQGTVHHAQLVARGLGNRAAVLADQHEDRAQHHLAPVLGGRAGAQLAPELDVGHVAHPDRRAFDHVEHDVADLFQRLHLARRAHHELLAAALDVAGAGVGVVAVDRGDQGRQRQPVRRQPVHVGGHQVFLQVAADGVHLGHAGDAAQLGRDDPVLDLAQVHRRVGAAVGLARALLRFHGPVEDLAQAGGGRPHGRLQALGQARLGALQALVHELACEPDVGAVPEHHGDLGQPVLRERTGLLQAGQAAHHGLDREGDALLDLERRIARRGGVDLHLDVGDVGHGVDRQAPIAVDAQAAQAKDGEDHQHAAGDDEGNEFIEHGRPFSGRARLRPCRAPPSAGSRRWPHTRSRPPGP